MRTDRQYQTFVRRLVEKLDTDAFPNSMSPEDRVGVAVRMTDALLDTEDFDLSDENVSVAAAIIWAFDQQEGAQKAAPASTPNDGGTR